MQEKKSNKNNKQQEKRSPIVNVEQPLQTWAESFRKFIADISGNVTPRRDIN